MSKVKGYHKYMLAVDVETTGLFYSSSNPATNEMFEYYQPVSVGLAVVETDTLKVIDQLYVEIKWDGKSIWSKEAARVHGLSLRHLEEHGVDSEEAVCQIVELILKYWGPDAPVMLLGHNVATFDLHFIRDLLTRFGVKQKFANKQVDTNSIGLAVFNTHNSDDLFTICGVPPRDPSHHNALDDALACVQVMKAVRRLIKYCSDN